ncbi:hypothetical protein MAR_037180 [Mya arenaria]|uniref:Secreted protein n=1 Tax=Mya arenaria TaxID=6604 RepID=A0ABY7FS21_MYAAR|nr:hypothetical protein MAR_037180 [Mya arenaria]
MYEDIVNVFRALWWWATWLHHSLQHVEFHTCFRLIFCKAKIVEHVEVPEVRSGAVPVLVRQPFPFACVGVTGSDVL